MDIPLYAMMPAGALPIIISKTLLPVCFVLFFFFLLILSTIYMQRFKARGRNYQ